MARYVPPVFPPIPDPLPTNPLTLLSDVNLDQSQYILALGCGRSKAILRERKRIYLCYLASILAAEHLRRHPNT